MSAVLALALVCHRLIVSEVVTSDVSFTVTDDPLIVILPVGVEPEESIKSSPIARPTYSFIGFTNVFHLCFYPSKMFDPPCTEIFQKIFQIF